MNLLDAAAKLLDRGFSIIPVRPDKKPFIKWEEFQMRRATPDEVREWWAKWPTAMIGIVTGKISGIVVVDIDSKSGREAISQYISDETLRPMCQTPRGGEHWYFKSPESPLGNNAGGIPGVDYRGEGGYIIAPPSKNGTGGGYSWLTGFSLDEVDPPVLPNAYINKILNSSGYVRSEVFEDHKRPQRPQKTTEMFIEGSRDEDLFHTANCLVKGGMPETEIAQVLKRLAKSCEPPFPEKEIFEKIESAMRRGETRERSLTQEIREWVKTTEDHIKTTRCHKELQMTTKREFKACTMALRRLCEEGILEKDGRGGYRKVDTAVEPVDFLSAPTDEFPIQWPLGIHNLSVLYPGNIAVIAGSKGAGKTALLLNTARLNQDRHEIVYLNSEMGDTEFRKRLELFEGIPLSSWKMKAFHRGSNFADLITGEKKIFIVDFLEVTTDFWKVAQYITEIHRKLKDGIAIIALQKSENREHGRGGDFSKEKSRLYLALDYLPDRKLNRVRIVDAKAWRTATNPRGMERHYKLVNGSKFVPQDEWTE